MGSRFAPRELPPGATLKTTKEVKSLNQLPEYTAASPPESTTKPLLSWDENRGSIWGDEGSRKRIRAEWGWRLEAAGHDFDDALAEQNEFLRENPRRGNLWGWLSKALARVEGFRPRGVAYRSDAVWRELRMGSRELGPEKM